MKKYLLILSCLFCITAANAQLKPFSFGVYGEAGMPTGDFKNSHNTGIGAGVQADIKLPVVGLGITASAGYMNFAGKSGVPAVSAYPVRAGVKYNMTIFYVKLEGGVANVTGDNATSAFILSPGVGLRLAKLDLQAKYEVWAKNESQAFWGLKAGFILF